MNHPAFAIIPPGLAQPQADFARAPADRSEVNELYEAYEFVQICNRATALQPVVTENPTTGERTIDVQRADLHPKQEQALTQACNFIGTYFAEAVKRFPRTEPSDD